MYHFYTNLNWSDPKNIGYMVGEKTFDLFHFLKLTILFANHTDNFVENPSRNRTTAMDATVNTQAIEKFAMRACISLLHKMLYDNVYHR